MKAPLEWMNNMTAEEQKELLRKWQENLQKLWTAIIGPPEKKGYQPNSDVTTPLERKEYIPPTVEGGKPYERWHPEKELDPVAYLRPINRFGGNVIITNNYPMSLRSCSERVFQHRHTLARLLNEGKE